jgi:WD40 repeat protein
VCFGNAHCADERVVAAGYDNGDVKLLDLKTMSIRWEDNVKKGVCHLSFDRKDIPMNKLTIGCLEGQVHTYDMRTFNPKSGYTCLRKSVGKSTVWGCHYLPQDREISAITSGNGDISITRYSYPMQRSCKGPDGEFVGVVGESELIAHANYFSQQPIISFDWNRDKTGLCAFASFDQSVQVAICANL